MLRTFSDWKTVVNTGKNTPVLTMPVLGCKELNGLLWFQHCFNSCEMEGVGADPEDNDCAVTMIQQFMGNPWEVIPTQILRDVWSASEYVDHLIKHRISTGDLSLKISDMTIKELDYRFPLFRSPRDYADWAETFPIHKPRLSRKRANGMWWMLAIAREAWELADTQELGPVWSTIFCEEVEEEFQCGFNVLERIAQHHETRFPTAPRGAQ